MEKTFTIDIKATGFFTLDVQASTKEEANQKALEIVNGENVNSIEVPLADEYTYELADGNNEHEAHFTCKDEECDGEEWRDAKTLAEAGDPYCPKCNGDMEFTG